jgi:hypothetical protein
MAQLFPLALSVLLASITPEEAAPNEAPAKESVTFKKVRPAVGDKEKRKKDTETTLKGVVTVGAQKVAMDQTTTAQVAKTQECLEVRKQECVKLKVVYEKDEERKTTNGKATNTTNPNQGKTYIVVPGKKPVITREDGSTPSAEEIGEIAGAYDDPPRNEPFLNALPDKVSVGDSLEAVARLLEEEIGDEEDKPTVKAKVVVRSFGEFEGKKIVTLGVTATLEGVSAKVGNIKLEMSGTLDILVDGAKRARSSFSGPMSVELPGGAGTLRGAMKDVTTASFSR